MECVRRRAARSLRVLCSFVPNSFAEMTSRVAGAVPSRTGPHRAAPGRTEAAPGRTEAAHTAGDATAIMF